MTEQKKQGLVEFRAPAVKLVADLPGDEEMREHREETMQSDGYSGACPVIGLEQPEEEDTP